MTIIIHFITLYHGEERGGGGAIMVTCDLGETCTSPYPGITTN